MIEWISSLSFYSESTGDIHSAVYCLSTLGIPERINKDRVVMELSYHWNQDGGFGPGEGGIPMSGRHI